MLSITHSIPGRLAMTGILFLLFAGMAFAEPPPGEMRWTRQTSATSARLRGVSAVSEQIAWASGSGSKVLRTDDGGRNWRTLAVTPDTLDFRDIDALDERTACVLSIGPGEASRIYRTTDAGQNWTEHYRGDQPAVFLDAMSFWDSGHGLVVGDSIAGQLTLLITKDGGVTWTRLPAERLPPALEDEGAFAASGTNIAVFGKSHAWIGTGGAAKSRVLLTRDQGVSWEVTETPLAAGRTSGIFSIAFRDHTHGVIVGGDYQRETEAVNNVAVTRDGGRSWKLARGLTGYRSAVACMTASNPPLFVAVGPSGADFSTDDGETWQSLSGPGFDTLGFVSDRPTGWGAGTLGRIGRLEWMRRPTQR